MTLPFEVPENNRRIFQCFVCGLEFESYIDYRDHILENHEEGRDYVRCPLSRCGAPIRDVRTHFKAKHPKDTIPKQGQMSAIVWRDIKATKKKRKKHFKEGFFASEKMKKNLRYRSSWEESVYKCLEVWDEVLGFEVEPFRIPYLFEGTAHMYVPDILVHFMDGHKELWEIKPCSQTRLEQNQAKWDAAKDACSKRGWTFDVFTEKKIKLLERKIRISFNEAEDEE